MSSRTTYYDPAEYPDAPPQLLNAITTAAAWLKRARSLRNKGFATDRDVEAARGALRLHLNCLESANWTGWNDRRANP